MKASFDNAVGRFLAAHTGFRNKVKLRWANHYHRVTGKPASSGLTFTIYESITKIPRDLWHNGASADLFLSHQYLTALEESSPDTMQYRYVVFYKEGPSPDGGEIPKPVAIAYFQILQLDPRVHLSARRMAAAKKRTFLDTIHGKLSNAISHRVLVCGNALLSGEHGFSYRGIEESVALLGILEAAYSIRKSVKQGIAVTLIKDFYAQKKHSTEIFSRFGFYGFDAGPNMVVPMREYWKTFDDYLSCMKSKYRKRTLSAIKKGAGATKRTLDADEIESRKKELFSLYCNVVDKSKYKLFVLNMDYFVSLKRRLGERFVCDGYFMGDTMIGFTTRIFNNGQMEGYTHGLSYELNKTFELYQNFLFDDIKAAIASNCFRINTGRTSAAMKSSAGAVPENMICFMRFSGRLSNQFVKLLFYFVRPPLEYCRNPFEE